MTRITSAEALEIIRTARANSTSIDLGGADLGGAYLGGADLRGADLRRADLRGADLGGAYLRGADLRGADLGGAYLGGADLRGADLGGADLRGADLRGADLRGADLRGADLRGADLRGADLRGADLRGAIGPQHWLQLSGLPSGEAWYGPTERGWLTTVGCYRDKPLADLKALVAQDEGWPEARGEEVARRRPGLLLWIAMCEEWERHHPTAVAEHQAGLEEGRALRARIQAETRTETPDA